MSAAIVPRAEHRHRTAAGRPWQAIGIVAVALAVLFPVVSGCRNDMHDQPKYKPLAASSLFKDGRAARPLVPGTVARGHLDEDAALVTGRTDAGYADTLPFPLTAKVLERGRERFNIYCSPCHDRVGGGGGMIVQRGYKRPSSFHVERLRGIPVGYFFEVATHGFGAMPSYATQVPARDRWAIAAYIRALQLSQHAALTDVPAGERGSLETGAPAGGGAAGRAHGAGAPGAARGAPHE